MTTKISTALDEILKDAYQKRASDIHLEPQKENIRLRYRIDGILRDVGEEISPSFYKKILSRIKLSAGLKLDVNTKAQDGTFNFKDGDKSIELRVSMVPSEYGENTVMRLLDPNSLITVDQLGLRSDDLKIVLEEIKAPNGMILNTGPTGSGKTTTLYSFLKKRYSSEIKIITIEDPIEYDLDGVEQTQVDEEGGYTFANGLASIMRQDPDVILVGEIRDEETSSIAMQAALTGHLVFSTIHANEAAGAIPRLINLKVKPTSIGPALNLIMAQRLVRKLCDCKQLTEIKFNISRFLSDLPERVDKEEYKNRSFYTPVGCDKCDQSGYLGRVGIFELLKIDKNMESMIEKQVSETEIYNFAIESGMVTIQQDGILKALKGVTSLEEVEKATGKVKDH